ncbi:MAG: hypothetical protein NZM43_07820 [Saprospiraceae bacterium]|nr:hypothetical protein [Saprospiraceae bacterium]MDW8484214.1 hypothetical protein [Saprospiraceae bacterium]
MNHRTLLCLFGLIPSLASGQISVKAEPKSPSCANSNDGGWCLTLEQGVPPVTFSWKNSSRDIQGKGVLQHLGISFDLTQLPGGLYRFEFTASDGKTSRMEMLLPEPEPLEGYFFVFAPPNPCTYPGWSVGFFYVKGGTPPYTYLWSNGNTSSRVDSLTSGTWRVTATDSKGCQIVVDTLVQLPTPIQADVQVFGESCAGRRNGRLYLSAISGGRPPYLFSLDNAAFGTLPFWDSLAPGVHWLHIEDAAGCSLSVAAVIPAGLPFSIEAGSDTLIFRGDTLHRTLISSLSLKEVRWQPLTGVEHISPTQVKLSPFFSTTYRITAISEEGCVATTRLHLEVREERKVYAPNAFWPQALEPENRSFTLYAESGVEQVVLLQVYDRQGQLCFERRNFAPGIPSMGWDGFFNGQLAASGVYLWRAVVRYTNGSESHLTGDVALLR